VGDLDKTRFQGITAPQAKIVMAHTSNP
jgi:hypothetical protein